MVESDIPVLQNVIEEELSQLKKPFLENEVVLTIVKSRFIDSFPTPSLKCYDEHSNIIKFNECSKTFRSRKRVIASSQFGSSKKKKFSTVFLKGSDDGVVQKFWFAQTLLLFHLNVPSVEFHKELSLVKFYTCTPPKDRVDRILDCLCLRWESDNNIDYTAREYKTTNCVEASENYGLVSFQSICGVAHVVRSNYAIHPFTQQLPWSHHRFYVNRFIP